jgi:hypothetical protein
MTKEKAISLAQQFVTENNLSIEHLIEARLMKAERFNKLYGYERYKFNFWVVEFLKRLPPGVAAETPGSVLVQVEEVSEKISEVYPGMP